MTFKYQYIDPNLMALFYWIKSNNKQKTYQRIEKTFPKPNILWSYFNVMSYESFE